MATFSTSWTTNVLLHGSEVVADAGTETDNIDLAAGGYYAVLVQVSLAATTGSPSGDCTIEVFGSADDGTSIDTEPLQSYVVNFTATATKLFSFVIEGIPWAQVKLTNSVGENVTYIAEYAGVKQSSA